MQQISRVIDFLIHYGGSYNRLDRALYTQGEVDSDHFEFNCMSVVKLLVRTLLHFEEDNIDNSELDGIDSRINLLYSNSKFPNLIDFSKDGVYAFQATTSFEFHCFIIVKYGSTYYYIGGYGGINQYVIFKLDYNTLYNQLYASLVEGNSSVYRYLFTNNDVDLDDFFTSNDKRIRDAKLVSFNMYYIANIAEFNIINFIQHFDMVVSKLTKDSYYPDIYSDVSSCSSGFCD